MFIHRIEVTDKRDRELESMQMKKMKGNKQLICIFVFSLFWTLEQLFSQRHC